MFASLRSRLWLTYLLLIVVILSVVTLSFLLFLVRNPRLAREAETNLTLAANALLRQRISLGARTDAAELQQAVENADELLDVRVILLGPAGSVLADSQADASATLPELGALALDNPQNQGQGQPAQLPPEIAEFTDENGQVWLFTVRSLQGRYRLIVATPRPTAPMASVFADDFFPPIAQAGLLALALSVVLAALMARSISAPLQRMSVVAGEIAEGERSQIRPQGPREVRSLAESLNEMSEKVHASQESQRDFVANVSHELKTPITSIQGFAQAILDGTASGGAALRQAAQVFFDEAGRMHRMVSQLLDLARLEAGTAAFERTEVDLEELLSNVARTFEPHAQAAKVLLETDIQPLPAISADGDRLFQVFTNLLENALKNTPEGGQVILGARQHNGGVAIGVSDSGAGIPAHELERIFERFYQVDRSRKGGEGRGVGLGLSIAQEIVRAHGGQITVESQVGQGSTFTVQLPTGAPPSRKH